MNGNLFGSVKDEYQLFQLWQKIQKKMQFNETKYTLLWTEFKAKLARILQDREEGFVRDGQLAKLLERTVATLKRGR